MFKTIVFALAAMLLGATAAADTPNPKLQGVWKLVETKTTGPNAATNTNPQPGLLIITAKHYSFIRIFGNGPRPDQPADLNKATAAELLAVWGPFGANAGTYEIDGDRLIAQATVAKNPSTMAAGARAISTFKLEGNTLWTTAVSMPTGPVANPETMKMVRVE